MSTDVITQFEEQEAQTIAQSIQFQAWSLTMITFLIAQQEQRLLDSDLPVDAAQEEDFWSQGL